jgi:hypothetical protein
MDHRAQIVLVLCKRLIVFPPTYLMVRRDKIGKPIALHQPYGVCAMNHKGIDGSRHGRSWRTAVLLAGLTAVFMVVGIWLAAVRVQSSRSLSLR